MDRFRTASAGPLTALLLLSVGSSFTTACGSPPDARHPDDAVATEQAGRVEPRTEAEKQVLAGMDQLKPGVPQQLGGLNVTADAPYLAASGQQCRSLRWADQSRLACRDEQGWYFAPDVFGSAGAP